MKIIKILFLGIVLVLFNVAYLAAQMLPDTISVELTSADPGGVMEISVDVRFLSANAGGVVAIIRGLPTNLINTEDGVDVTGGAATAPTAEGTWWYEWTEGYGVPFKAAASVAAEVTFTPGDATADDPSSIFGIVMLGPNVDNLKILPTQFGGFDPDAYAAGPMLRVWVNVPNDVAEGTYEVEFAEAGASIGTFSPTGTFDDVPYTMVNDLVVFNIPDNNYLDMVDASQNVASDGYTAISVMIANRDTVATASFDLTYPGDYMTLDSVVAGSYVEGANVTFSAPQEASGTMLAANMVTSISVSGGTLTPGGGELVRMYFDIGMVGAGVEANVALSNAAMTAPGGGALTVVASPGGGATSLSFSYGDTLSLGDMMGEGTAIIIDRQLHVPVVLKNASSVSSVRFYISEPAGMEDILSLADEPIMHVNRADGWMTVFADSGSYVQVISYSPIEGGGIAPGDGQLFHVVFDIDTDAFTVPAPGSTVDLTLGLSGVELVSVEGAFLGVESMGGVASLDYRVPNGGEGVGPGATLPKAFALAQNHPNPFNPSTTINYQIPDQVGSVSFQLNVYDIRGKLVRTLDEGLKGAGTYSVYWDGTDNYGRQISSGVYFYRFTSSKYNATRKMIMLK